MKRILTLLGCLTILLCLTACGKTAEVSAEASDAVISNPAEITFQVKFCNADAVTRIAEFDLSLIHI